MTQQEFHHLSKRYLEGQTTPEEELQLMEWWKKQPISPPQFLNYTHKKQVENRIWQGIRRQIPFYRFRFLRRTLLVSASAAAVAGLFFWIFSLVLSGDTFDPAAKAVADRGVELSNTTTAEQKVTLEDGTVVLLQQNSSLVYDKSFNEHRRVVYLSGEAFFQVKKDVSRPFIVYSGGLIAEVLGTSFWIKQKSQSHAIEVVVKTGKVSVYTENTSRKDERNGVILTPNQRVVFDEVSRNIVPSIVEDPLPISVNEPAPPQLIFEMAPLQTVLDRLSEIYGIEFVVTNSQIGQCRITADLNGLSMFTQLELVCKSIDAGYEKRGTVVFISGDGC